MANRKYARDFHDEISDLVIFGLTNPEISEQLRLSRAQVACYTQKFLGGNPNYMKKKTKHKHLRKDVMTYFLENSLEDTRNKFGLTESEIKSVFTVGYRDKSLKHLRKDNRRRDPWSTYELRFLLRWSGIISRKEINKHMGRGNSEIVIKEKLQQLGLCSKNVNGMTRSQFKSMFKKDPIYYLRTAAGSPISPFNDNANWIIVPWCHIEEMLRDKHIFHSEAVNTYIKIMAIFQRWIHGGDYWKSLTSEPKFIK